MHADTSAIDAFGIAQDDRAASLDDIRAALSNARDLLTDASLGPVGARFTTALADALERQAARIADVCRAAAGAADTARATSVEYLSADGAFATAL